MATCTFAVGLADTTDGTSFTTGSFTPVANDVLVVFVSASGCAIAGTVTGTNVPGFFRVTGRQKETSADTLGCFVGTSFAGASSQTVTYDCTGDTATGCIVQVWRVAGLSRLGAHAVVQVAGQANQGSGTPSATFTNSCNTNNPTLATVFKTQNTAMSPPTSWTEGSDIGHASPGARAESAFRNSGFTGTNIPWIDLLSVGFCDVIIELDASTPLAQPPNGRMLLGSGK